MKVKKYRAADSQQAMRMVKAAHGPDAVVLDCYSVADGVEFVVSYEETSTPSSARSPAQGELSAIDMLRARQAEAEKSAGQSAAEALSDTAGRQNSGAGPKVVWSQDDELLTMKREMADMKNLLMSQLKGHNWQDASHQAPQQSTLHRFLAAMDMDPELGRELISQIPAEEEPSLQREVLKMLISQQMPVAPAPSGGVIALVGPQGAGKTTAIAKLAAQHVIAHGRDNIAILTTDTARVGAQEQLKAYGRILQVPVHGVSDAREAVKTFRILSKKSLLLVDTAGVSFRDRQGMTELNAMLTAMPGVQVFLNLPADTQSHVQREIIDAYRPLDLRGALVARIDEASRLGGVISNLINEQLPAVWFSNGPNVPRNLSPADAGKLVKMAVRMGKVLEDRGVQIPQAAESQAQRVHALG